MMTSRLELVDKLGEVMVTVLAKILRAQGYQLILVLDVVDADLALLHQFLHEKNTSARCTCARTIGGPVVGDMQRRRDVDIQRHAAEALVEAQLQYFLGA